MIELTEDQQHAVATDPEPCRLVNPRTNQTYVLIRAELYERLKELLYDDGPWTDEEMDLLKRLADSSPLFHLDSIGKTGEGRSIPLLLMAVRSQASPRRDRGHDHTILPAG